MGNSLSVLIVEDSEDDMLVLIDNLECNGYDLTYEWVDNAISMNAALEQQLWDVIICDYIIPGFGATEALALLQQKELDIPFIITSGTIDEEIAVTALKAGAHDFILKSRLARLIPAIERERREADIRRKHRQTEAALHVANNLVKTILESITDAFIAFDHHWCYSYVNQEAAKLLKKSHCELIGKNIWEEVFPDAAELDSFAYRELNRAVIEQVSVEFEYYSQILELWLEVHAYPSGEGLSVYFRDITQRKQTEVERAQLLAAEKVAREEAEAANRLKDEFLATLSHELRSPLNAIIGWVTILRTRFYDEPTRNRAIETIERNAKAQSRLVEDLLDVSRIIRGQLQLKITDVDLVRIIGATIDTVKPAVDAKEIQLQSVLDQEVGLFPGDSERLQQIIWNLLNNAVKFTPKGGKVEVHLQRLNSHIEIVVSDTGKGINPEFLPYVFERFRQGESSISRNYGGLGLGLAIVRQLVELHGGTVKVASPGEGLGSTFTVNLPLVQMMRTVPVVEPERVYSPSVNSVPFYCCPAVYGLQVLVVDDDIDVRDLLVHMLQQCGMKIVAVGTVREAILILTQQDCISWDVLISDLGMPGEDGYVLIQKLRQLPIEEIRSMPAIALTAYARNEDSRAAIAAGFDLHIAKPVEPLQLVKAIANLTTSRQKNQTCPL